MTMPPSKAIKPLTSDLQSATSAGANALRSLKILEGEHHAVVGLSGGVDSSLTAAFLAEAGWKIEGLTLWLMSGKGSCCSDGLVDAAAICEQLGISHHIVDSRSLFKNEIVGRLISGYQEGITPLPCSQCNRSVKFAAMLKWVEENYQGARIATGHYARIKYAKRAFEKSISKEASTGRHQLLRGLDTQKDQSYFLYDLSQDVLGKVVFPLGELTKSETRKESHRYGLRTANKAESQDLCLAEHHGSMKAFLDTYLPPRKGEIVLNNGRVIGEHDGIEHFTIGQRKGLGVSWQVPLHVVKLEPSLNRVVVAPREEAGRSNCIVSQVNWVSIEPPSKSREVEVQVRYRSHPVLAELTPITPTDKDIKSNRPYRCNLQFDKEQFSITPGQAAVFYSNEILLGGGLIEQS